MDEHRFETREVHAGLDEKPHGAINQPIFANSTYAYDTPADVGGRYRYGRMASPTRDELEAIVANLEGSQHASAFASGMAAIDAVFSLLESGDHVIAARNLYAETHDLLRDVYPRYGIDVTQVDIREASNVEAAMRPETALVYVETPTNPLLNVGDIEAIVAIADAGDALVAVDNTFASPYLQRPLERGADIVAESLTKFIGGHSDTIIGAVATNDDDLADRISTVQYTRGAIPGPFDCYLAIRGSRTLSGRVARQCANARAVAEYLAGDGRVERVYYPGLRDHPNHEVAAAQMDDFGSMVSVEVAGGTTGATAFVAALEVFTLAESLGAVESLVEVPAIMTHQDIDPADRAAAGITDGLVRLSLGTEHEADLIEDVDRGLAAAGDAT